MKNSCFIYWPYKEQKLAQSASETDTFTWQTKGLPTPFYYLSSLRSHQLNIKNVTY